jgi:nicotinamidase-related amidase
MNTALLIIDIQNDYFEGGRMTLEGAELASLNAKKILEEFRKNNFPVIHIRHIATRSDATFFLPGTEGSEIHKNVEPLENEKIIIKHFPNSFRETELSDNLTKLEITDLVICGMMTHMCVDATVRAARDFGFNCTLIGDACATRQLEINGETVKAIDVHNAFLAALNGFYAKVVIAEEFTNNDFLFVEKA